MAGLHYGGGGRITVPSLPAMNDIQVFPAAYASNAWNKVKF